MFNAVFDALFGHTTSNPNLSGAVKVQFCDQIWKILLYFDLLHIWILQKTFLNVRNNSVAFFQRIQRYDTIIDKKRSIKTVGVGKVAFLYFTKPITLNRMKEMNR